MMTYIGIAGTASLPTLRFRVQGAGLGVQGAGFGVQGAGCRIQGARYRMQGAG